MRNTAPDLLDALTGASAGDAYERLGEAGDGLPVGEPSRLLVDEMVSAAQRPAAAVVVRVPPLREALTVHRLAVCAALAGCEPRHLPVLVAACEALVQPELNALGFLTTTGSAAPLLLVNGDAARDLGFNGGANCLGPGNRANATVGRCLSFVVRILGGARAGLADMATTGQPAKYTCCFAENEAASPWAPFHVDLGYGAADGTVTVMAIAGTVETFDAETGDPHELLGAIADVLAGSAPVVDAGRRRLGGGQPLVVLSPESANRLAGQGLSKRDVQAVLHARAVRAVRDGELLPVADAPDDVLVVVAGGVGAKQTVVPNWNGGTSAVTRRIEGLP